MWKTKKINLIASDDVDQMLKGNINISIPEENRKITDFQIEAIEKFKSNGNILTVFNKTLFIKSDSREPEVSGVLGAIIGSFYCLFVAACISVPIGIFAAIFLQEFAKRLIIIFNYVRNSIQLVKILIFERNCSWIIFSISDRNI